LKRGKQILQIFGCLDIISIALLTKQIYTIGTNFSQIPDSLLSEIRIILLLLSYLLLFISATGLLTFKKYGLIAYYIHFPIRLLVWVFSFGFITFLSDYSSDPQVFDWLFRLTIVIEFFRLYFTVRIHRRFFRRAVN
jgi:hypothetical protein